MRLDRKNSHGLEGKVQCIFSITRREPKKGNAATVRDQDSSDSVKTSHMSRHGQGTSRPTSGHKNEKESMRGRGYLSRQKLKDQRWKTMGER